MHAERLLQIISVPSFVLISDVTIVVFPLDSISYKEFDVDSVSILSPHKC